VDAIEDFTRALETEPENADALLGRGLAFTALANFEAAAHDLEQALRHNPTDELIAFPLALSYFDLGEVDRARDLIQGFGHWSDQFRERATELLRAVEAHPRNSPRPEDAALQDLYDAQSPEDVRDAIEQNPILWNPGIQGALERHIAGMSDDAGRARLDRAFRTALQILRNPAQLAFNAFMAAENEGEMRRAVDSHELLRTPDFIAHLRRTADTTSEETAERINRQLGLYIRTT